MRVVSSITRLLSCLACGLLPLLVSAAEGPPSITTQPAAQTVLEGTSATFSVVADGTAPLGYQWRRNGVDISGATGSSYTIAAVTGADNGINFSVVVSNALNTATSADAMLRVDPGVLVTTTNTLVNINTHVWRYYTNGGDLDTAWRQSNYVDSAWPQGSALFGVEVAGVYAQPIQTPFTAYTQTITTYYFRAFFPYNPGSTTNNMVGQLMCSLAANIDDGAVFYLNGEEFHRVRMPLGQTAATFATGDAEGATEALMFTPTNLVVGMNCLAVEVHQQTAASSDIVFGMNLTSAVTNRIQDTVPPVISSTQPLTNITVLSLTEIEVNFSEAVQGVNAGDLRINTVPASSLMEGGPGQYVFAFPQPATGLVQVTFAPGHGITDQALTPNAFAGASWSYTLDPNAVGGDIRISEFMTDNQTGIRDEDGDRSDWIEIHNASTIAVDMTGWSLTDNAFNPAQWLFPPGTVMQPNSYLLVWASQKNRTNPFAPLHTNFRLDPDGEFLGLYAPNMNLVSSFGQFYPEQRADVSYGRDRQDPDAVGYYSVPSPGQPNPAGGASSDFAPNVVFSRPSGAFRNEFNLALDLSTPSSNAVIRYVLITNLPYANLNNVLTNVPTAASPAYTTPFPVPHTMQVRARAFEAGKLPGAPVTMTYIHVDTNIAAFSSDLPICVLHTLGANSGATPNISLAGDQAAVFMTFDNDCGRSSMTNAPQLVSRVGINARGSSTGTQPKSNFAVELWDEFNLDTDHEVLGMPEESDWVLYAMNGFDQSLMHNAIFHWFGRQLDNQFASRTRFVEVYRKIGLGTLTTNDYFGLYLLEEKPKRNRNRADIEAMQLEDTNAPAITGGYLLRIDRTDAGETFFSPPQIGSIRSTPASVIIDYPNYLTGTTDPRAHLQSNYIRSYIQAFITNLTTVGYTNLATGYHQFIDADQWVDNLIGNIICFNVDGYRLSGYFHKDRNERLRQGPYWDCDRCLGTGSAPNNDNRCFSPFFWRLPASDVGTDNGTDFFGVSNVGVSWFTPLFRDPDFWQRFIDRYQMHRTNAYSTNAILSMVDGFHNQIRESQRREQARWGGNWQGTLQSFNYPRSGSVTINGYTFNFGGATNASRGAFLQEVNFQKQWLTDRLLFLDTNFLAMPTLSRGTEQVASGATATVTPAAKAGTLLIYTLDGTDPRLPGGGISPTALSNAGPVTITITDNVRLVARSFNSSHFNMRNVGSEVGKPLTNSFWSGPVAATYYTTVPPLRITELMYHPLPPSSPGDTNDQDNFEYIEVRNISGASLNVNGFRLRGGVDFDFPNVTLTAGQSAVLVRNIAAFQARYGMGALILGSYSNNLANDGDHLVLQGSLREPILDFDFEDGWYPITDGQGFSLQIVSDALPTTAWGTNTSWRPSGTLNGTPGAADPGPLAVPVVYINEILTHTDLPAVDAIELFNPNGSAVNVGGWFLTDDFGSPKKYRIPNPTMIGGNSYLVLYADTSFGATFNLSSKGDEVYLFSGDPATTNLTGRVHGFDFGAQANGVTFGRYLISSGNDQYPAQTAPSLGSANSYPKVGPFVISEVMYHPPDVATIEGPADNTKDEYVEIANLSSTGQPLFDPQNPANTWKLRDAVSFTFPPDVILSAGERALVVSFDPVADPGQAARFRALYGLSFLTRVFGPYDGQLDNSSDSVELVRPDVPQPEGLPDAGVAYDVLVDKVNYRDSLPWPTNADGFGPSLHRVSLTGYGNDSTNWLAAAASAGVSDPVVGGPVFTMQPQSQTVLGTYPATFTVAATGTAPIVYQWYFNETEIYGATEASYTIPYTDSSHVGDYRCRAFNPEGSTLSSIATLNVVVPARITSNPTNITIKVPPDPGALVNRGAVFRVMASSMNPPLTFQWQFYGTNLPLSHPTYVGVTSSNLIVTNMFNEHAGPYRCAVTDQAGTVYSIEAQLITTVIPVVLIPPTNQVIYQGDPVTLTVFLSNACTGPFNYVWRSNSLVIASNHMSASYSNSVTIFNVPAIPTNLFRYRCDIQSPVQPPQGVPSGNALITTITNVDRDMDGINDPWEQRFGFSTNNNADAYFDPDGDGMINLYEFQADTVPTNALSVLRVTDFLLGAEETFNFLAVSNRTYSVQTSGVLPAMPWVTMTNISAASVNRTIRITNAPAVEPPRFLRLVTPQQP